MSAVQTRNASYFDHRDSGKLGLQQQKILDKIREHHRYGRADFSLREIAAITGLEINAVSGRVNELKQVGLLVEKPLRKCRITGRTVTPIAVREDNNERNQ